MPTWCAGHCQLRGPSANVDGGILGADAASFFGLPEISESQNLLSKNLPTISFIPSSELCEVAPWSGGSPGLWDFAGEFKGLKPQPKARQMKPLTL